MPDQQGTGPGAGGNPSWFGTGLNNFTLRIVSAAVLAPVVLLCAYFGGWVFFVLCAAAAAGVMWEWTRLVVASADPRVLLPALTALLAALLLTGFDRASVGIATVAIAAHLRAAWYLFRPRPFPARNPPFWVAGGVVYSGIVFLAPALIRRDPAFRSHGGSIYRCNRLGHRYFRLSRRPQHWRPAALAECQSKQDRSGAIGGLIGGVAAATMVAYASGITKLAAVGLVALVLSVLTQAGDLLESAVKRRFGAKDTGRLIPGHGGLMDRLDGFVVAALAAVLIGICGKGRKRQPKACWYGSADEASTAKTVASQSATHADATIGNAARRTGSIGSSTIDLLRREPELYRVKP